MANGDTSWHDEVPRWIKSVAFIVGVLGAPMTVAFFFMGQSAGWIPSIGGRNTVRIDNILVNQDVIIREIKADREEGQELVRKLTLAMRITCRNSARDAQQQGNCEMIQ
jgi:hypothetical protein